MTVLLAMTSAAVPHAAPAQPSAAAASPPSATLAIVCEPPRDMTTPLPAPGADCTASVASQEAPQAAVVRLRLTGLAPAERVAPRALVRFTATDGHLTADTARVDAEGVVTVVWTRAKGATAPVMLAITATAPGGRTAARVLTLTPAAVRRATLRLSAATGTPQAGYEKSVLRFPLVVEILDANPAAGRDSIVTDSTFCRAQRVVFRRASAGGSITPDTSLAVVEQSFRPTASARRRAELGVFQSDTIGRGAGAGKRRYGCFARSNWTLGEGPGYQDVRAVLVPGDTTTPSGTPVLFSGLARSLPKIVAGYAGAYDRRYLALSPSATRIVRVERPDVGGGSVAFDSTVKLGRDTVVSRGDDWRSTAVLGVSFAPRPRWRSITTFVGVGAADPANDWYLGLSAFRLARRLSQAVPETEGLIFDTFFIVNVGRPEMLKDADACAAAPSACETVRPTRLRGIGVMASLDAGSLIGDVFKKLIGP